MKTYKECPNGHYYAGDTCPYCKGDLTIEVGPENNTSIQIGISDGQTMGLVLPPEPKIDDPTLIRFGFSPSKENKVCPNYHKYTGSSPFGCPYCGEWRVIGYAGVSAVSKYRVSMAQGMGKKVEVTINGKKYYLNDLKISCMIWDEPSMVKSNYVIEAGNESVEVTCNSDIRIGSVAMTGKEFIKMCDVIINNEITIKARNHVRNDNNTTQVNDNATEVVNNTPRGHTAFPTTDNIPYWNGPSKPNTVFPYNDIEDKVVKTIFIGRSSDDNYIINDPLVTRHHCKIEKTQSDKYYIENLGENGTRVNGRMISGKILLQPNDVIEVGNTTIKNPYNPNVYY